MQQNNNGAKDPKRGGARFSYRVRFAEPPESGSDRTEFFFKSVAAIFGRFDPRQVGSGRNHLWNVGVANGEVYRGKKCTIERVEVE